MKAIATTNTLMKIQPRTAIRFLAMLTGILLITGCATVGPDYVPPQMQLPDQWHSLSVGNETLDTQRLATWWQALNDPALSRLIEQATTNNHDVLQARSRVREARYRRLQTRAALFPALDATGPANRSSGSEETGSGDTTTLYQAGFDASWELDLFGGNRRSVEAAQADLESQIADGNDVMVALLAEVAVNYIDLRTYQARLAVAQGNVATQQETWELLDALFRAGSGDALAVDQARYNLASSRATIPDLEVGRKAAVNRLAVLIGKAPGALRADLATAQPIPQTSLELAVGVPADIIRQRPDIRRAERELAAQTARIGEAEADLYPKFSLSGSIGLEALSLGDLISAGSQTWSFGPTIQWPLFDAGKIRSNIKVQGELQQQALLNYASTVLAALEEVENALVAFAQEQQKLGRLEAAAEAARSAARLAEKQYTTGMTGFSDVLEAQRSMLSFEDQLAESCGAVIVNLVQVYKSLGGGWQPFTTLLEPNVSPIEKG
jgi:NodT family efflux transporter outer membrane factor (OMF) lipoprotein